ncbi:reverse transcriptase domain-containing protein [Tanacetum coccineum]
MSPENVARDRNNIKKWIWSKTLSQKSYKQINNSCDTTATTAITSTTEPTTSTAEPATSTTTTHHRTHHLHHTSTVPPPPPPTLNHNSFLNPLNDNSSTSFSNPLIVGGDILVTVAETTAENEPRARTSRGRERAEPATEVMVIDKSWTYLERSDKAFYTGLKKFVEHCKPLVNSSENVKCPCKSCRNVS